MQRLALTQGRKQTASHENTVVADPRGLLDEKARRWRFALPHRSRGLRYPRSCRRGDDGAKSLRSNASSERRNSQRPQPRSNRFREMPQQRLGLWQTLELPNRTSGSCRRRMQIDLHPKAREAFDSEANTLRSLVSVRDALELGEPSPPRSGTDDSHVVGQITDREIIGTPTVGLSDQLGNWIERWEKVDDSYKGIAQNDFSQFAAFCNKVAHQKALRNVVGESFVVARTFAWLIAGSQSVPSYTSFLLEACEAAITEITHWVVIAHLRIPRPIELGAVTFRRITKNMLDAMEVSYASEAPPEHRDKVRSYVERLRRNHQSYTAGVVTIAAEPDHGRELAIAKVDTALSLLRFFDVSSMTPEITSNAMIFGDHRHGTRVTFTTVDGRPHMWCEAAVTLGPYNTDVHDDQLRETAPLLATLSNALNRSVRTEYEDKVITALVLYSRVSVSPRLSDKLVYALVALESVFLRNDSEPIQTSLGDRLAFFVRRERESRKQVAKLTKAIYGARSRLVHHGKDVADDPAIKQFMFIAWTALCQLTEIVDRHETIASLLDELDNRKYS